MDEPSSSRWALVIRDDGEARVVPLADVSVIDQGTATQDKNSTVIVWHADEQAESSKTSAVRLGINDDGGTSSEPRNMDKNGENLESLATLISLSTNHLEDFPDELGGTVITLADAAESLSSTVSGCDPLEKIKIDILPQENLTPVTTDVEVHEDIVVNCDLKEPSHIIRAHAKGDTVNLGKPICHSSLHACFSKIHVSQRIEMKSPDGDEGGGGMKKNGEQRLLKENCTQEQSKKKDDYFHQVKNWTKRLPPSSKGAYEPFERVEATLHKDVISQLGIGTDNGIFLSLHQQGAARGVRVTETDHNQVVVSGSLVELLASRDLILREIDRIRGGHEDPNTSVVAETSTKEVGVMCELIPSPPMARYASSLGLDRSARRYHSVLSRPLSPEPRPQRRKSRRQILSSPKEKSSEKTKVLRSFSQRYKVQIQHQNLRNTSSCFVKREENCDERVPPSVDCSNDGDSTTCTEEVGLSSDGGTVEMLLDTAMKTEPGCNEPALLHEAQKPELSSTLGCDMNEVKPVIQLDIATDSESSYQRDFTVRLAEEKMITLKQCSKGAELNNKENIEVEIGHLKSKEQENIVEDVEMDYESDKIVCETEADISEGKDKDVSKDGTSKDIKFKFSCNICSYKSMRENHFVKHMKLHDKGLALYRCNECSFVSIRASHLRRHKMSHAVQVLKCHLCAYTCDDKKLLTKHVRVKHQTPKQQRPIGNESESREMFECDDCEYKTSWQYSFQRHRRSHLSSKMVVIHACPDCPYKTMRREHFLRHIKNVHQNHRPFLCDICGKAFKRQDALKQHHVTHYQNIGSSSSGQMGPYGFICHICQKVCRSSAYLKEHMATHSEERSFLCEVCGASFKTRSVQRNHVQTIHRRPRAFTCTSCDKKFNTKFALRRHMKQHDLSLEDAEGLPDITGTSRICSLQHSLGAINHTNSNSLASSNSSRSIAPTAPPMSSTQAPTSAYQITIDGEPAFILPHIGAPLTTVEEEESTIIGDTGTVLVEGNTTTSAELPSLSSHPDGNSHVAVPVGPSTVHIVEQDTLAAASGNIILSPDQYGSSRASGTVASDTPNYVTSEHTNSTLLYLTANFE